VGADLLAMWGVPHLIVEAVAHHHHPERVAHQKLDLVSSLYFANWIANDYQARVSPGLQIYAELNEDIVTTLGVASKFEEWQELAGSVAPQLSRV
jgi:HD-like signal output (HDOD) protein